MHEAQRFVVEAEEAQDKLNAVQNTIFSSNEEMDRFKLQMNWNQEELEQWALAAKQKEEDNLALQKYARADDVKIKELRCVVCPPKFALLLRRSKYSISVGSSDITRNLPIYIGCHRTSV